MIIESIRGNAIPYKCPYCYCVYLWKPNDISGKCVAYKNNTKCDQDRCKYFLPDIEIIRCPVCGESHGQERIGSLWYKILKAIRSEAEWPTF